MLSLTLALLLAQADNDRVKLKTGEEVVGRLTELADAVIVEVAGAAPREIKRAQIETIDYARDYIRFPTIAEYRHDGIRDRVPLLEAAAGRVIFTADRSDAPLIVLDPSGRRPPLELPMQGRLRWRTVDGRFLYVMTQSSRTDDAQKILVGSFEESKTVHELTFHAVDLFEMEVAWTRTFDNNDRDDLYWSFVPGEPLALIREKEILLIVAKQGNPIDKKTRRLDQSTPRRFTTLYEFAKNPAEERVTATDVDDFGEIGPLAESKQILVWQETDLRRQRLVVYDTKKKKIVHERLQSPPERFLGLVGEAAYLLGENYVTAIDLKKFAEIKGFPIGIGRGTVERIDGGALVVRRADQASPSLVFFDLAKGKELYSLPYGKAEDLLWRGRAGKYILFSDLKPSVIAYDTLTKAPAWRATGFKGPAAPEVAVIGNTVYALAQERLTAIDLHTGERYWEVDAPNVSGLRASGGALAGNFYEAVRLIRERWLPEGARVPSPMGLPPRVVLGHGGFGAPFEHDGALWSLHADGKLVRFDFDALAWDEGTDAVERPIAFPPTIVGASALFEGLNSHVLYDLAAKKAVASYARYSSPWPESVTIAGNRMYLRSVMDVVAYDLMERKEIWKQKLSGPYSPPAVLGERLLALEAKALTVLDPATGKSGETFALGYGEQFKSVHVDGKGRVYLLDGGAKVARRTESLKKEKWRFEPKVENALEAANLPGPLVMTDERLVYLHGGNELVGLDPETGGAVWTVAVPQRASPLLLHGGAVYFADHAAGLRAVNVADGTDARAPIPVTDPANFQPFLWKGEVWFWSSDGYAVPSR